MARHASSKVTPARRGRGPQGGPAGRPEAATVLQQSIGNRATAQLLATPSVQRQIDMGTVVSTMAGGLASLMGLGVSAASVLLDVASGVEPSLAVVRQLLESGVSEGDATDLLLFVRHPELKGRKLGAGDDELIAEWKAIRSGVVRPLVRAIEEEREAERGTGGGGGGDADRGDGPTPTPVAPGGGFITDTDRSYLDGLPGGAEFRDFPWHRLDFPGAKEPVGNTSEANLASLRADPRVELIPNEGVPKNGVWYLRGANQAKARKMFALLARHVPERRANTGSDAVLTEAEFAQHEADYDAYITAQTMAIPGQTDKKLNKHAAASFVTIREVGQGRWGRADREERLPVAVRGQEERGQGGQQGGGSQVLQPHVGPGRRSQAADGSDEGRVDRRVHPNGQSDRDVPLTGLQVDGRARRGARLVPVPGRALALGAQSQRLSHHVLRRGRSRAALPRHRRAGRPRLRPPLWSRSDSGNRRKNTTRGSDRAAAHAPPTHREWGVVALRASANEIDVNPLNAIGPVSRPRLTGWNREPPRSGRRLWLMWS